jgi:arthrofactin-type cyclic lipopeptide synthetase C
VTDDGIELVQKGSAPDCCFVLYESDLDSEVIEAVAGAVASMTVFAVPCRPEDSDPDLEAYAGYKLELIRRHQPDGPFHLIGCGPAAMVALESAMQLREKDEPLGRVGLISPPTPGKIGSDQKSSLSPLSEAALQYWAQPCDFPVALFLSGEATAIGNADVWRKICRAEFRFDLIPAKNNSLKVEPCGLRDALRRMFDQKIVTNSRSALRPFVAIQSGVPGGAPIICFPGAGANGGSFLPLCRVLGNEFPVFSFMPRGLDGVSVPVRSVSTIVDQCIDQLPTVPSNQPYRLLGHSFGGWIALEVAQRLAATGARVAPVAILDSDVPGAAPPKLLSTAQVFADLIESLETSTGKAIKLSMEELDRLSPEQQLARLRDRMVALGILSSATATDTLRGVVRVYRAGLNARYHVPKPYPGEVLFFAATKSPGLCDGTEKSFPDAEARWAEHVQLLRFFSLDADHFSMLVDPTIQSIARTLRNAWAPAR